MSVGRETTFRIATAPKQNSKKWTNGTITWGELLAWLKKPSDKRESGGYVLGSLDGTLRNKKTIRERDVGTLDADTPGPGFFDKVEVWFSENGIAGAIHTTFNSTLEEPRYRIWVPFDRSVKPDEYYVIQYSLMNELGLENFDIGSAQAERYMFRPAAKDLDHFRSWTFSGEALKVEPHLKDFDEDLSKKPIPKQNRTKRDPYEIDGVVGAFNRAFPIEDAVEHFDLPYEQAEDDRWHLIGARSAAGMGPIQDAPGLFFSHHLHDPAYGRACSVFDMVRMHLFGELDVDCSPKTPVNRLPSNKEMLDLASNEPRVIAELVGIDFDSEMEDLIGEIEDQPDQWKMSLRFAPRSGKLIDDLHNWDLIMGNDDVVLGLFHNEMTGMIESELDLPWRPLSQGGPTFTSTDLNIFATYISRVYRGKISPTFLETLLKEATMTRWRHPIRDYLNSLEWDGIPRVEHCLPADASSPYVRLVARKSMVAAVARAMDPGCKWDHTLIIAGDEGLGKSWFVERMANGFSAPLTRVGDKDTLLIMQRSWIMTSDEGFSFRKADSDALKEFLTRTEDVFRAPYEKEARAHKRHCVIWGTTNDKIFLRQQEGNRRYLIVRCEEEIDFGKYTDEYVDQVWAEAVHLYKEGEKLFLSTVEKELAGDEREEFIEDDAKEGMIQEFLSSPVPSNWEDMSPETRQVWRHNRADGFEPEGTEFLMETCSAQIWVEAFHRRYGEHRRADLLEITKILKDLPGWRQLPGRVRIKHYGPQVVYKRVGKTPRLPGAVEDFI